MTGRVISQELRDAVFSQETGEVFIGLLTISHPNFVEDIRVCDDPFEVLPVAGVRGVVSRGDEYVFLPFKFELPGTNDTGTAKGRLQIDNVDQRIVQAVRTANSALRLKIEIMLSSNVEVPRYVADDFRLDSVTYDALTVEGDLSMEYYDTEPFPQGRFTPSNFPGIF